MSTVRILIDEGFLSSLITKASDTKLDVSGVHIRGGEFINSELQSAVDQDEINKAAVREIIYYGKDRKSWLVFCSGVQHAYNVKDALRERNILAETVTGETNMMERDFILSGFKSGEIRAITNCDILTTGFNAPNVDLLAVLRPTQSTGLYVQIAGRGMRIANGKENCLVLDFAGNIERHGPIDRVNPFDPSLNGNGKAPVKTCPGCRSVIFAGFRNCPDCNHEFPPPAAELNPAASTKPIISEKESFWVKIKKIRYSRHSKVGKPDSLRVDYFESSLSWYSEWICLEHGGFAAKKAHSWWERHGGDPDVTTVTEALQVAELLKQATRIYVQEDGKYWRVLKHRFGEDVEVEVEDDLEKEEYEPVMEEEEAPF